jgi:hypothetical protein
MRNKEREIDRQKQVRMYRWFKIEDERERER